MNSDIEKQDKHLLTVVHRVCPALSRTACRFTDKYEMVKSCSQSLTVALSRVDAKLIVILDGCDNRYEALFPDAEIIKTESIGNQATFNQQLDILSNADSQFVYFSEDDYLYKPSAFEEMIELANQEGVDIITPIDHPDRYNGTVTEPRRVPIRATKHHHWRETGTACLTFMTRPQIIRQCRACFQTYVNGGQDSVMWLGITKFGLFSPSVLLRSCWAFLCRLCGRKVWFGKFIPLMALATHRLRLIGSHRYHLWSPLPALAEHLSSESLSPVTIDLERPDRYGGCAAHAEQNIST